MHCLREERVQIQNYLESQGSLLWKTVIIISFSVRHEYLWHQHSLNISVQPHITVMESEQSFEYFFLQEILKEEGLINMRSKIISTRLTHVLLMQ